MEKIASLWHAPLPDYGFRASIKAGLTHVSIQYIICAITGIALCFGIAFLIGKLLARKKHAVDIKP